MVGQRDRRRNTDKQRRDRTTVAVEGHPRGLARATASTGGGFIATSFQPRRRASIWAGNGYHQSPANRAAGLIFCSGMLAINPETGEREHGTVTSEARRIFKI